MTNNKNCNKTRNGREDGSVIGSGKSKKSGPGFRIPDKTNGHSGQDQDKSRSRKNLDSKKSGSRPGFRIFLNFEFAL
jgi:hypothetical protein